MHPRGRTLACLDVAPEICQRAGIRRGRCLIGSAARAHDAWKWMGPPIAHSSGSANAVTVMPAGCAASCERGAPRNGDAHAKRGGAEGTHFRPMEDPTCATFRPMADPSWAPLADPDPRVVLRRQMVFVGRELRARFDRRPRPLVARSLVRVVLCCDGSTAATVLNPRQHRRKKGPGRCGVVAESLAKRWRNRHARESAASRNAMFCP
jgi:hypothetical protein